MRFFRSDEGQGLVEYALVLVLVGVVAMAVIVLLGPFIGDWLVSLGEWARQLLSSG
ncbi:MAG TPA: hypothetical protein VF434_10860 [Promineifilum sp.]